MCFWLLFVIFIIFVTFIILNYRRKHQIVCKWIRKYLQASAGFRRRNKRQSSEEIFKELKKMDEKLSMEEFKKLEMDKVISKKGKQGNESFFINKDREQNLNAILTTEVSDVCIQFDSDCSNDKHSFNGL